MSFISPEYFWLLLFLVAGLIKNDLRNLSFVSYGYIVTFIFVILALTRPVIEQESVKTKEILSDVIIAVDLSYSMQSDDIKPTRLSYAKSVLKELVMANHDFRFGILGFTTNAIVLSPLTQDRELLLHLFSGLDDKLIMTKGSSIQPALALAKKMSKSKNPIVVILTDGADKLDYKEESLFAKKNRLRVNIFMCATKLGGTISLKKKKFVLDSKGDIVVTRENENISEISLNTNGIYTKDLKELLTTLESQKNKDFKTDSTIVKNMELFYYFIFLAIITFLITTTSLKKFIIILLVTFGVTLDASILESFKDKNIVLFENANRYYKDGNYTEALESYKLIKSNKVNFKSILYFNMANSYVRLKKFKKARENYMKSLTLLYSLEADENLEYIKNVSEEKIMSSGKQKSSKKLNSSKKDKDSKKKKEGGGSNMKVSAKANDGAGDIEKKLKTNPIFSLDNSKAKLSSKQYELINKKGIDEISPW